MTNDVVLIDKFQFYDKVGGLSKWKLVEITTPTGGRSCEITCNDHLWHRFEKLENAKERFNTLKKTFSERIR